MLNLAAQNKISLGNRLRKIDIVLQNALCFQWLWALDLFKAEFYLTPPSDNFDMGTLPWSTQLALHGTAMCNNITIFTKDWARQGIFFVWSGRLCTWVEWPYQIGFTEGDAVFRNCIVYWGRGRMPTFLKKAYPTLWTAGKTTIGWNSVTAPWRIMYPTIMTWGICWSTMATKKYGPDFWKKITSDAAAFEGLFYPMQRQSKLIPASDTRLL